MALIDTTVRNLQVGDITAGSRQTIVSLGPVSRDRQGPFRNVTVRTGKGELAKRVWKPGTTMRVERAGG